MGIIKVFYFVASLSSDWLDIVQEQIDCIYDSGLYDEMTCAYVCIASSTYEDRLTLGKILPEKYKLCYYSKPSQFEYPAMHMIKEHCKQDDKILYLHTKGVSRVGAGRVSGDKWREYMNWGCIERYKEHIEALKKHDISGVQLTKLNRDFTAKCGSNAVYAGNYFWANGRYIEKLNAPEITSNRWGAEGWIFMANPTAYDLHNLTGGEMITNNNTFNLPDFSRKTYDPDYKPKVPPMVQWRYEILNSLINKFGYSSYLEIGIFTLKCFKEVSCKEKVSVDPAVNSAKFKMTSDEFFMQNNRKFDIVFIDGLHTKEQVLKDIENALECLSENGAIVCHDMMPNTSWEARATKSFDEKGLWTGDVYKAWIALRISRPELSMYVIDADCGCGIIRRGKQKCIDHNTSIDFNTYIQNRAKIMNVIEPEDFYDWIETL